MGVILAGVVLGAATLIMLQGRRPKPKPIRVKVKDGRNEPKR